MKKSVKYLKRPNTDAENMFFSKSSTELTIHGAKNNHGLPFFK